MSTSFELPYFPRNDLLQKVMRIYETNLKQGVTLFAPRRQGKTAFVKHELLPAAKEVGWQTLYVDLWKRRSEPELGLVEALEAMVELRQSGLRRKWIPKSIKTKAKSPAIDVEATLEPVGFVAEGVLENRLDAALTTLVGQSKTLLVLDEVQALAGAKRADFVAALRTTLQKLQDHLLVFYTGSSREGLNTMFRLQRAPLFGSTMAVQLPELGEDFIEDRLVFLQQRMPVPVSKERMLAVFEDLGRTPEFLHDILIHLILAGNADIDAAVAAWTASQAEDIAGGAMIGLRPIEMAVMKLLATSNHPSIYAADALAKMTADVGDRVTAAKVQTALKKLARLELVSPTGNTGEYEIEDRAVLYQIRSQLALLDR